MGTLDAVLEPFLQRQPPEPVRHVLRLGAAGVLLLETPPHAAVATAVALTRARGLAPFAGLVNAVLRRVATAGPAALAELDGPRLDTPSWLWSSWGDAARAIATAHQHPAPLDLTLRPGTSAPPAATVLPTGSVRFPPGTLTDAIPGFDQGLLWVQDAAAALPARLLAPRPGERVADLCAAPGGKTAQLAAAGADCDRGGARSQAPATAGRQSAPLAPGSRRWCRPTPPPGRPPRPFDAVLLDAPCSATGTIRRHPDVPRIKRPRDVQAADRGPGQAAARRRCAAAPGGRLIYAVCSLQPEEGAPRIAAAIARGGLRHDPFMPDELADLPEALTPDGFLRTHPGLWPDLGGMDGFFAARLTKSSLPSL